MKPRRSPRVSRFFALAALPLLACAAGPLDEGVAADQGLDAEPRRDVAPPSDETTPATARAGEHGARIRIQENMADPDVLRIDDEHFLLSGTQSTVDLPLYTSSDLRSWTHAGTYSPSRVDPAHDYCFIWAPDLARKDDTILLHFSAHRVAKGSPCPPPAGREVTTYRAEARVGIPLDFSIPRPLWENGSGARTYGAFGCPPQGCDRAIRIDSSYDVESDRLLYTYFDRGNNIASVPMGNPGAVLRHSGPAATPSFVRPYEEGINEGPDIFRKDGLTFMFFSTGHFQGQYAQHYVVGPNVESLTRSRSLRRLSTPIRRRNGKMLETHGHNSVVAGRGEIWNFFHVGVFDGNGNLIRRDVYQQPLAFGEGGHARSQNEVRVRWTAIPNAAYSLDVVLRDGSVIGPCIDNGFIGRDTATTFTGVCPGAGDRLVAKSEVAAFRVFWTTNGTWTNHAEVAFDGIDDAAFVALPGGRPTRVGLSWNELAAGTEYSLDVRDAGGRWTGPCVGANVLHNDVTYEYDGVCRTPNTRVDLANVSAFRLCSAMNGNWGAARCVERPNDGASRIYFPQ